MPSVRTLVTLKRGGRSHPPGSWFHDLTEAEISELGAHVEREPDASLGSPQTADASEPAVLSPETPDGSDGPPEAAPEADEEGSRVEQIACAIDLLDGADFEADGRPKLGSLSDVLGFEPSPEELSLALAMRADEGL